MKLLVSDYDGTFYTSDKKIKLNIEAINKFRENGNKFAIATGRNYNSIKKQIDKYDIKYDYLICNNGLIIFDSINNIIDSLVLSKSNLEHVLNYIKNTKNIEEYKLYNLYSSTKELENILEVYIKFIRKQDCETCKNILEKSMENLSCYIEKNKIFIGCKATKASAINFIKQKENISIKDIYTIGDNENDLEMLIKYFGYRMLFSNPNIWFKNIPIKKDVYTLVKNIDK